MPIDAVPQIRPALPSNVPTLSDNLSQGLPSVMDPDTVCAAFVDHYQSQSLRWGMVGAVPVAAAYSVLAQAARATWQLWQSVGLCDGEV